MRVRLLGLVATALVAGVVVAGAARNDAEKIQGTWTVVSATDNGRPVGDEKIKDVKVVLSKTTISLVERGETRKEMPYTIDAAKKPKWIDVTESERKQPGIYELDGDDLKICVATKGDERTTKFESPEGSSIIYLVLKRDKK